MTMIMPIMTITEARISISEKVQDTGKRLQYERGMYERDHGEVPAECELREMFGLVAKFMSAAYNSADNVKAVLLPVARDMFFSEAHPGLTTLNRIHSLNQELRGYYDTTRAMDEGRCLVGGDCPQGAYSPAGFHPDQKVWVRRA